MVPFWVCYGFLVRDYHVLRKKGTPLESPATGHVTASVTPPESPATGHVTASVIEGGERIDHDLSLLTVLPRIVAPKSL